MSISIVLYRGEYIEPNQLIGLLPNNTYQGGIEVSLCNCDEGAEINRLSTISLFNKEMTNTYTLPLCIIYNNAAKEVIKFIEDCSAPYFYYAYLYSKGVLMLGGNTFLDKINERQQKAYLEIVGNEYDFMSIFSDKTFCELINHNLIDGDSISTPTHNYTDSFRALSSTWNGDSKRLFTYSNVGYVSGISNKKFSYFIKEHLRRAFKAIGFSLVYGGIYAKTEKIRDLVLLYRKARVLSMNQNYAIAGKHEKIFDSPSSTNENIVKIKMGATSLSATYNSIWTQLGINQGYELEEDMLDLTSGGSYWNAAKDTLSLPSCGEFSVKLHVRFTFYVLKATYTRYSYNISGYPSFPATASYEKVVLDKEIDVSKEYCCSDFSVYWNYSMQMGLTSITEQMEANIAEADYNNVPPFINLYIGGERYPIFRHTDYLNEHPLVWAIAYDEMIIYTGLPPFGTMLVEAPKIEIRLSVKAKDEQGVCEGYPVNMAQRGNCLDMPVRDLITYMMEHRNFSFIQHGGKEVVMIHNSELITNSALNFVVNQENDLTKKVNCEDFDITKYKPFSESPLYYGYVFEDEDREVDKYHRANMDKIYAEGMYIVPDVPLKKEEVLPPNEMLSSYIRRKYTNSPNIFASTITRYVTYYPPAPTGLNYNVNTIWIAHTGLMLNDENKNYRVLIHKPNNIETQNVNGAINNVAFPKLIFSEEDGSHSLCYGNEFGKGLLDTEWRTSLNKITCAIVIEAVLYINDYDFSNLNYAYPVHLVVNGQQGIFFILRISKIISNSFVGAAKATLLKLN